MHTLKTKIALSLANQKDEGEGKVATPTGLEPVSPA